MTSLTKIPSLDTATTLAYSSTSLDSLRTSKTSTECPICLFEYYDAKIIQTCSNKHRFCKGCLTQYLQNLIDTSKVLKIPCPQADCKEILDSEFIQSILDPPIFEQYQTRLLAKLMNRDLNIKFCPKPGCSRTFTPSEDESFKICECGTQICNVCSSFWHEGKTCLEALDAEFEIFSQENELKFCIMCKSVVQRVEGCTHITCPVCDYEWCWICGRQYTLSHARKCPNSWKPMPPQVGKKNIIAKKLNNLQKSKRMKILFFILTLPLRILLLPMLSFGLWDQLLRTESQSEQICLGTFGIVISLVYNLAIVAMIAQIVEGGVGLLLLIPLLILFGPYMIYIKRTIDRRRAVGTFVMRRWTTRDPTLFQYTSIARPVGENNINAAGMNADIEAQNGLLNNQNEQNQNHNNNGNDVNLIQEKEQQDNVTSSERQGIIVR